MKSKSKAKNGIQDCFQKIQARRWRTRSEIIFLFLLGESPCFSPGDYRRIPLCKFPAAGNLAANFFAANGEFCRFCPKSTDLCSGAGNGAGFTGISDLTSSHNGTYQALCSSTQQPSREKAGNPVPDCGYGLSQQRRRIRGPSIGVSHGSRFREIEPAKGGIPRLAARNDRGTVETSASFEARYAPLSYLTAGCGVIHIPTATGLLLLLNICPKIYRTDGGHFYRATTAKKIYLTS